ncbi:MAG: GGDEF domain-containing protein [Fibrobacter sp.]|jgi:diguanylate cyclase (GGDEF)-like protein|nr:GGDEF domain-containing protein [Fibrobacter sp.]MBR6943755.1 GGDEF domain-containing protein [Fibrobacter sp.]
MNIVKYIFWLVAFLMGVIVAYVVPEETMSIGAKFIFVGAWGAVLGFVFYTVCKRQIESIENDFNEVLNRPQPKVTQFVPIHQQEEKKPDLPPGAIPAAQALKQSVPVSVKQLDVAAFKVGFPLETWNAFKLAVIRNRPFTEVIDAMQKLLPELFPDASGVLYMYGGVQTELSQIFRFGPNVISDETVLPAECASFNTGDIVVTDYSSPEVSSGCTHLHHRPKGLAICAPVEGLEEHFGILTIQVDKLPETETKEYWQAKVSIVSAAFGLYVANQDLNMRFEQHSIRDVLTGLFNRRYMEESLNREITAAMRHKSPIGIVMLYPDAIPAVQNSQGRHAVEQLFWELGQRLPSYIRGEDIPCRYSDDVFCVIMPGADLSITRDRAERIRNEISQLQIAYGEGILATTLSMGVAVMPTHAKDAGSLIYTAEASLQMAMQAGGNRVVMGDAVMR